MKDRDLQKVAEAVQQYRADRAQHRKKSGNLRTQLLQSAHLQDTFQREKDVLLAKQAQERIQLEQEHATQLRKLEKDQEVKKDALVAAKPRLKEELEEADQEFNTWRRKKWRVMLLLIGSVSFVSLRKYSPKDVIRMARKFMKRQTKKADG